MLCLFLVGCGASPTAPSDPECVFYLTDLEGEVAFLFLPTDRVLECGTVTLEVR